MAVIQISKIQVRRGLQQNLPQLASGEFGWSIDERRLYIGNGTLSEGAPEIGVTEIFTEHSSISQAADIADLQANVGYLQVNLASVSSSVASLEANLTPLSITLADNVSSFANVPSIPLLANINFVSYTITRNTDVRVGTLRTAVINGVATYDDDYTETSNIGVMWNFLDVGSQARWQYVTSSTGHAANLVIYPVKAYN